MPSVLLSWAADRESWPDGYGPAVGAVAGGGSFRRSIPLTGFQPASGTEVWLVLGGISGQGPRGLAGHGVVAAPSGRDTDPVIVDFDLLLPLGEQLPESHLADILPALPLPGEVLPIPAAAVPALRRLWSGYLGAGADPLSPVPGTLDPGAVGLRPVNDYEHDAEARRLCLAFFGTVCAACGLVPAQRYGPGTESLMQVHHLVPGPDPAAGYVLDPVSDLVPLCPTCHAVAHTGVPVPFTPAEVRGMLASAPDAAGLAGQSGAGVVLGSVVTAAQQQALEDAARLRGLR
ncbi:HNH endonuclease [Arthrobacter yangruifuii]|uniref:HNH endonuclease n=1 Tax=Arthrobacter yangruifuii TaxID=2606616 RepID=UPI0011B3BC51|nr:restriction endonuclease [Arthrobacter yangruifuii]